MKREKLCFLSDNETKNPFVLTLAMRNTSICEIVQRLQPQTFVSSSPARSTSIEMLRSIQTSLRLMR